MAKGKGKGRPAGARGASGKGELLGKRIWKKYPNHYLAGGAVVGLGGVIYLQQQGIIPEIIPSSILDMIGLGTAVPWSVTTPVVVPGAPVGVTGKAKGTVYYTITDFQGKKVGSGTLGGPGAVTGSIATGGMAEGDYNIALSDSPDTAAPGGGGGAGAGTYNMTTMNQVQSGQPSPEWSVTGTQGDNQGQGFQTAGSSNLTLSRFGKVVPLGTT